MKKTQTNKKNKIKIELERNFNQDAAYDDVGYLLTSLRVLHKSLCTDKPTTPEELAERHVLALIASACAIEKALEYGGIE